MQSSKAGAHLLLQTRVQMLNGALGVLFKRGYPDVGFDTEAMSVAVAPPVSIGSHPQR